MANKNTDIRKNLQQYFTEPIVRLLARTPLTPNAVTIIGFLVTVLAAVYIATGEFFIGGIIVLAAGFLDMLDGALARLTNQTTRFGAVLDSTLDRLSEAALMLGILVPFASQGMVAESLLVGLTLVGSLMVSYLRARAEGIGIDCKVGLFTRAERVIVLALGLLLSQFDYVLVIALVIIALFSFFTAGQRLWHAYRQTRNT
ncbi:MAG: CDP-alcohol phosphatidyltransferase family protein [Dehalococcoidales bacterium]|nr:CDP-alcohol phosphatidyltransferase family protein [Dehalococcoidales bacterium]